MVGRGPTSKGCLGVTAEIAAKRLPVWLSTKSGRNLIPRPIGSAGLPHRHLDCLLRNAAGVGSGLD
jgi:hypothetical protein